MSVKIDLDQLARALADFTFAYLITVGDDYHAHTVAVEPVLAGGMIDVGTIGTGTGKNATARARWLLADRRRPGPTHGRRHADCRAQSRGAAPQGGAGGCDEARLQRRLHATRKALSFPVEWPLIARPSPKAVTQLATRRLSWTRKSPAHKWTGLSRLDRFRSPCRPCHRSGRTHQRPPSPACRRRPPRWSGTT